MQQLIRPVKYFYTLHRSANKQPFVVHLTKPDETSQTTILSFTLRKDAQMIGAVYEQHKVELGDYPENYFTYEKPFNLDFEAAQKLDLDLPLQDIYVHETPEEDMYEWCIHQHMDLMIIYDIESIGKLQVIEFSLSIDALRERFENNLS